MIDILLYSHHLPAWYCIDTVRRNSVLVTCGSERVKGSLNEVLVYLEQLSVKVIPNCFGFTLLCNGYKLMKTYTTFSTDQI